MADQTHNAHSVTKAWLRALQMTAPITGAPERVFPKIIEEVAEQYSDQPALLSETEVVSFRALAARINRYARWATAVGFKSGDCVGLLMPNCPEYLAIWLGITSVGGIVSLLNTDLTGSSLAHCINVVHSYRVIATREFIENLRTARPHLQTELSVWLYGDGPTEYPRVDVQVQDYPDRPLSSHERLSVTLKDPALYIYTSGTTGLPKAATVTHYRIMEWTNWFAGMLGVCPTDRMYNCLPMYHSVGGIVAIGSALVGGGSVVIKKRFSARDFWEDIVKWDCTLFQYIGELCRYLLRVPLDPNESKHKIRIACGNGLRSDIWSPFKDRFKIPYILEFYAATEGNVSLYNVEGRSGAIGRVPLFLEHRFPVRLIKLDTEKRSPVRTADGFCTCCAPNEAGEAIGSVLDDPVKFSRRFDGYTSTEDSEKRIIRNVFEPGDAWFRTGDLMRKDEERFFYFVDRIGDTFRCKGHNVSTTEVGNVLLDFPGIMEATVYGVSVPHIDGRFGMAVIVPDGRFDLADLPAYLDARLPRYAQPAFLRICQGIGTTSTFKYKKQELIEQAYEPDKLGECVYLRARESDAFVPLGRSAYDAIKTEKLPL